MRKINVLLTLVLVSCLISSFGRKSELLKISCNSAEQTSSFNPEEWQFESQREEIAPVYFINNDLIFRGRPTLTLSGNNKEHANGCWFKTITVIPDQHYRFRVYYKTENVSQPWRSVLARIIWFDESDNQVGRAEYPRTIQTFSPEGWEIIEQVYKVPDQALKARLELIYRWEGNGRVHFGDCSFNEVDKPSPRLVRLATIHHRPVKSKGAWDNLEQFASFLDKAGEVKADIVCLPEAITMVGTGHSYHSSSEPVPGPTTKFLGQVARRNNMYIVAGILEKEGEVLYNTAILIDRNGELAGKYRKVSLPREEIEGGITPGKHLPVFETDFGRIGMMICWDVSFPEVARTLTLKGAEVILMPIWGGNITMTRARAIENQVYLVTSTYNMKSAVFNLEGEILVEATEDNQVVVADVDLNKQMLWPWLGDFKNRIRRELPSHEATR